MSNAYDWLGVDIFNGEHVHALGRAFFALELGGPAGRKSPSNRVLVLCVYRAILDALRLVHQKKKEKVEGLALALLRASWIPLVLL
jgi:hypothetical protein